MKGGNPTPNATTSRNKELKNKPRKRPAVNPIINSQIASRKRIAKFCFNVIPKALSVAISLERSINWINPNITITSNKVPKV